MKKLLIIVLFSASLFGDCKYFSDKVHESVKKIDDIVQKDMSASYYHSEKSLLRFYLDNTFVYCENTRVFIDIENFYFGRGLK